ncbi:MAG: riboflavin synthase [Sphingomicrobium sp.]
MFTGIITDIGRVRSVEQRGDRRLVIETAFDLASVDLGASIACSGVCLTVVDKGPGWFAVDVSGETVSRTAAAMWDEGAHLNLERALRLGDELGGHFVTGHVDGIGTILVICREGDSTRIGISVAPAIARYIAEKGSVTLDGVSLTVNEVADKDDGTSHFAVNIIPHTGAQTTLGGAQQGRQLNVEIDVFARYLDRMTASRSQ